MNKKIKVFSLTTTYPESPLSSRPKFVHVLNRELVKLGVDVLTITPHSKDSLTKEIVDSVPVKRFRYLPENYEIHSTSIFDAVTKSKTSFMKVLTMMTVFFFVTFAKCLRQRPDILHAHWAFPGFIAYIVSTIFGKKFIVTIHGGETLLSKFPLLQRVVIHGLNKSSAVVLNSNFTRNKLIKMGVKDEKIIRINVPPDFVDKIPDKEFLEQFRKRFADPSYKIILFTGRLVELKGPEYVIRSLVELEDLKVHLIVAGGGELREQLKDLVKSLGLENKVTIFGGSSSEGGASREDLTILRSISDVFVCPSIIDFRGDTEGLPMVIPEAMNAGLPVVASSVGGIVDIVKHEINGLLVNQKDPSSIAQAVRRILSDEKFKKELVENSKKTIKEFSPESIAKQYFDIYQDIVNKK